MCFLIINTISEFQRFISNFTVVKLKNKYHNLKKKGKCSVLILNAFSWERIKISNWFWYHSMCVSITNIISEFQCFSPIFTMVKLKNKYHNLRKKKGKCSVLIVNSLLYGRTGLFPIAISSHSLDQRTVDLQHHSVDNSALAVGKDSEAGMHYLHYLHVFSWLTLWWWFFFFLPTDSPSRQLLDFSARARRRCSSPRRVRRSSRSSRPIQLDWSSHRWNCRAVRFQQQ